MLHCLSYSLLDLRIFWLWLGFLFLLLGIPKEVSSYPSSLSTCDLLLIALVRVLLVSFLLSFLVHLCRRILFRTLSTFVLVKIVFSSL